MKAKPLKIENQQFIQCSIDEATHVELKFPLEHIYVDWNYFGEIERAYPLVKRILPIILKGTRDNHYRGAVWSWNGDIEKPTLKPSILTYPKFAGQEFRCHSFVNDGQVKFLSDCSHDNANKTLELLDIE